MDCFVVEGESASLRQQPLPVPKADEALVRVLRAGVCNTDLEIMKGYMGFAGVVGHEFVGVVDSAPAAEHLVGKRVVGDINLACCTEACKTCAGGGDAARNHCPTRTVLGILGKDGTYAQYLTLPTRNLHVVPDSISDANACFAEPLAAACRIVEQGIVKPTDRVAVVGDGKLGLLCAEVLGRHMREVNGPRVTLVGRHEAKMRLLSADAGVDTTKEAPARSFEVVVDATGHASGLASAKDLCVPLGTVVLKSTCAAGADFHTAPFVIDELRVIGSRCGPFEPALELLANGLDLEPLICGCFPLKDAKKAVEAAGTKGSLKVQLLMQ